MMLSMTKSQQEISLRAERLLEKKGFTSLTRDIPFKAYFTRNKDVLIILLSDFLPLPKGSTIADIEITNPEMMPKEIKEKNKDTDKNQGKAYRLDIRATIARRDNSGSIYKESVNIEMQASSEKSFGTRVLLYSSRMLDAGSKRGEETSKLPSVYSLVFTTANLHNHGKKEHCIHYMRMRSHRDDNYKLSEKMTVVIVELAKFKRGLDSELSADMENFCGAPRGVWYTEGESPYRKADTHCILN